MATVKELMNSWAIARRLARVGDARDGWTAMFQDSSYDAGVCETCGPEMVYMVDITYYDEDGGYMGYEEYRGTLGDLIEEMSQEA